jgi:hypothetical protein
MVPTIVIESKSHSRSVQTTTFGISIVVELLVLCLLQCVIRPQCTYCPLAITHCYILPTFTVESPSQDEESSQGRSSVDLGTSCLGRCSFCTTDSSRSARAQQVQAQLLSPQLH